MPLKLTLTEGVLPVGSVKHAITQLSYAMLKHHGLTGNKVMTSNITATVHVLPKTAMFLGGKELSGAWVEWKVPSFAFASREVQQVNFQEATNIIHKLSDEKQPKNSI